MDNRKERIKAVISIYEEDLLALYKTVKTANSNIDFADLKDNAFHILNESLTDEELTAILKLEGSLKGKFPGVQNRLRKLFSKRVKDFLTAE